MCSDHSVDELVDEFLSVSPSTTILVRVSLLSESLLGGVELEGPEEVVGFLEVGSDGLDLVDEVFNAGNAVLLGEGAFNDRVVGQGNSGAANLAVASLVDKLSDHAGGGVAVSNVGLNSSHHVHGGFVKSHEHTVVELSESQKLQDLFAGGVKLVDTISLKISTSVYSVIKYPKIQEICNEALLINKAASLGNSLGIEILGLCNLPSGSDDESKLCFRLNEEVTGVLGGSSGVNK